MQIDVGPGEIPNWETSARLPLRDYYFRTQPMVSATRNPALAYLHTFQIEFFRWR